MSFNFDQYSLDLKIAKPVYLRILNTAVVQAEDDLPAVAAAIEHEDHESLQTVSHRWKGDFANLRIASLSEIARELNNSVKAGGPRTALSRQVALFKERLAELKDALNKIDGNPHE